MIVLQKLVSFFKMKNMGLLFISLFVCFFASPNALFAGYAQLISDNSPDIPSPYHIAVGDELYFMEGQVGGLFFDRIWKTDGTSSGTTVVFEPSIMDDEYGPHFLADSANGVLFSQFNGEQGRELWKIDKVTGEITLLRDICSPNCSFKEANGTGTVGDVDTNDSLFPHNGTVYFSAKDQPTAFNGPSSDELWKSDGTTNGTVKVKEINPGDAGSNPKNFIDVNGALYFWAYNGVGTGLYTTDGTSSGTVMVKGFEGEYPSDSYSFFLSEQVNAGGNLFFSLAVNKTIETPFGNSITRTMELWKYNSSSNESNHVKTFYADADQFLASLNLASLNDKATFIHEDLNTNHGRELWISDGTADGTYELKNIHAESSTFTYPENSTPNHFTELNGVLYFSALDGIHGNEIWKTDGTEEGTVLLKDINPDGYSSPKGLTIVGDEIFFSAYDREHGVELWKTDGTPEGTVLAADVVPEVFEPGVGKHSTPDNLINVGGTLFFQAFDADTFGREYFIYVDGEFGAAEITEPVSGSTLSASAETFTWSYRGLAVEQWALYVGSSIGASDYFATGAENAATSTLVSGLPTDGSQIYATLWYRVGNTWDSVDASYTAATIESNTPPEITSPVSGSTLSGSSHTFNWNPNGIVIDQWALYAGSSVGAFDYFIGGAENSATSSLVTGLPTDGSQVYVQFWYFSAGSWNSINAIYTAVVIAQNDPPEMTSPVAGSTFTGTNQTFIWDYKGNSVEQWALYVGSSEGAYDYHISGAVNQMTSAEVSGLPTDGSTVYVQFWYRIGDTWGHLNKTYTAVSILYPEISSPVPGTDLTGAHHTFTFDANGYAIEQWALYVGSSVGAYDYHIGGAYGSETSTEVYGLPTDGSTVYVEFCYRVGQTWGCYSANYTAVTIIHNDPPEITSPVPGTVLNTSNVTFTWNSNGNVIEQWVLYAGSTEGGADYHASNGIGESTSAEVIGLPVDGTRVYIAFWYRVGEVWASVNYFYDTEGELSSWYIPPQSVSWQWQLQGVVDTSYDTDMYIIDLFDSSTSLIQQLQGQGRKVFCHFSIGTYENWRDDAGQFPLFDLGNPVDGDPNELYINVISPIIESIMFNRLDLAVSKGCDGVVTDNVDTYWQNTGFIFSYDEQMLYNKSIANEAHERLLSVGLQNALYDAFEMVDDFDFVLDQNCIDYGECYNYDDFTNMGKAVLNAEHSSYYLDDELLRTEICDESIGSQYSTIFIPQELDNAYRYSCF